MDSGGVLVDPRANKLELEIDQFTMLTNTKLRSSFDDSTVRPRSTAEFVSNRMQLSCLIKSVTQHS